MGGRRDAQRPVGWGPDFVLGWLRENPTGQLSALLEQVAPRCGTAGIKPSQLAQEIAKWKRMSTTFAVELRDLVNARRPPPTGPGPRSKDRVDPDWRLKWADCYLRTRNYTKSAAAAGIDRNTAWRKRKPGHPEFDQEFYDIYCGCQEALKEHYEDVLHWSLEEAELQGDARTVGNLALTILERVDKGKWTRAEDRNLSLEANVHHTHTLELSEGAQKAMRHAEILSQRFAGALGPGPAVIDVTPRVVEKVAVTR